MGITEYIAKKRTTSATTIVATTATATAPTTTRCLKSKFQ